MTGKELIAIIETTDDNPVYIGIDDNKLRYTIGPIICSDKSTLILCDREIPETIMPKRSTIFLNKLEGGKVSVIIKGYIGNEQIATGITLDLDELNKIVEWMNQQEAISNSMFLRDYATYDDRTEKRKEIYE